MKTPSARQIALISWLLIGISLSMRPALCNGENGIVIVQVQDLHNRPVAGVEIGVEGNGGSAITGSDGKARISIGSAAMAGEEITLTVRDSPKGKDLAVISPWNGRVPIPRFEDKPENYLTLVVVDRGKRSALENDRFVSSVTASVISEKSKQKSNSNSGRLDSKTALAAVAREYGYSPKDLDRAIRAWGKRVKDENAPDPYEAGLASLYERDFSAATRQLQESLAVRQKDLAAARQEAAEKQRVVAEKQDKVASAAFFLGSSLYDQGKYEESADAFRQCLQVRPDDPFVIDRAATSLRLAGDIAGAASLTDQALAIARKQYGTNDPALASALDSAGQSAVAIGDHSKAESLIQQAVQIDRRALAERGHQPWVRNNLADSLDNLGVALQGERKFSEAERDYDEAISINRSLLGPNNLEGASYRNNRATLYKQLHEDDKAEQEPLGLILLRQGMQGQDHPQVATEFRILSEVYSDERRAREAESYARQALEIDRKFFKENSVQVGLDLEGIGNAVVLERNYQSAENYLERSANVLRVTCGPESLQYGEALRELGNAYRHLGKNSEAEQKTHQALAIYERTSHPDYHWLAVTWEQMASIYQQEHKCSERVAALKNALSIALKGLGPDHHTTKSIQADLNSPHVEAPEAARTPLVSTSSPTTQFRW